MTEVVDSTPFYKRLAINLVSLSILLVLLYIGQGILIPLSFAILLSVLLLPIVNALRRIKIGRILSIVIVLFGSLAVIFAIVYFMSSQVSNFLEDFDKIQARLNALNYTVQHWVKSEFGVTITKQNQYIQSTEDNMDAASIVSSTFLSLTGVIKYLVFIPLYTFLVLFYKDLIKQFLIASFHNRHEGNVREILYESKAISQKYIIGLMIDMSIVFGMYASGFLILGIKYALFLALAAAILNILPYIGMVISGFFCMLITLVSSESLPDVFWVAVIIFVGHLIDNNFLLPRIVGSKVKINALATLLGVLVGGSLCGVPGMFLSVPVLAVLKVIFDRIDGLKPYGLMLGSEVKTVVKPVPQSIPTANSANGTLHIMPNTRD